MIDRAHRSIVTTILQSMGMTHIERALDGAMTKNLIV